MKKRMVLPPTMDDDEIVDNGEEAVEVEDVGEIVEDAGEEEEIVDNGDEIVEDVGEEEEAGEEEAQEEEAGEEDVEDDYSTSEEDLKKEIEEIMNNYDNSIRYNPEESVKDNFDKNVVTQVVFAKFIGGSLSHEHVKKLGTRHGRRKVYRHLTSVFKRT